MDEYFKQHTRSIQPSASSSDGFNTSISELNDWLPKPSTSTNHQYSRTDLRSNFADPRAHLSNASRGHPVYLIGLGWTRLENSTCHKPSVNVQRLRLRLLLPRIYVARVGRDDSNLNAMQSTATGENRHNFTVRDVLQVHEEQLLHVDDQLILSVT